MPISQVNTQFLRNAGNKAVTEAAGGLVSPLNVAFQTMSYGTKNDSLGGAVGGLAGMAAGSALTNAAGSLADKFLFNNKTINYSIPFLKGTKYGKILQFGGDIFLLPKLMSAASKFSNKYLPVHWRGEAKVPGEGRVPIPGNRVPINTR